MVGVSLGLRINLTALFSLDSVNVGLAGIGSLSGFFSKLLVKRIRIHDKVELADNSVLALNMMNLLLGKSLIDNYIADDEFKNILD